MLPWKDLQLMLTISELYLPWDIVQCTPWISKSLDDCKEAPGAVMGLPPVEPNGRRWSLTKSASSDHEHNWNLLLYVLSQGWAMAFREWVEHWLSRSLSRWAQVFSLSKFVHVPRTRALLLYWQHQRYLTINAAMNRSSTSIVWVGAGMDQQVQKWLPSFRIASNLIWTVSTSIFIPFTGNS